MSSARKLFISVLFTATVLATSAGAFSWEFFDFPAGDQHYLFEIVMEEDGDSSRSLIDFTVKENGGLYDATTSITFEQQGVELAGLGDAVFGGSSVGLMMFGPAMLFYGPGMFLLPIMLANEEIAVRAEPIVQAGVGTVEMNRTEVVAGHECVVISFVPEGEDEVLLEFALAEELPFPCFSIYHDGGSRTTLRMLQAD